MKLQARALLTTIIVFTLILAVDAFAEDIVIDQNTIWSAGTYDYNNVSVTNGAVLTCEGQITLNAQNLTVDSGASISADGKGYGSSQGPGAGTLNRWDGAGYGGRGAKSSSSSSIGGSTYGSVTEPEDMGSGGSANSGGIGGSGGGAIRLAVANALTVNGSITSNGQNGPQSYYSGGGSGGSVYITTATFAGDGVILANGGNGSTSSGGGGGGRIAVYCDTNTFTGNISVRGGTGYHNGGAGTIYTKLSSQTLGDLLIDNESIKGARTTLPDDSYTFDKVEIQNEAILELSGADILDTTELRPEPDGQVIIDNGGNLVVPIVQLASGGELILNNGGQIDCDQFEILSGGTFLLNTSYTLPTMEIGAGGVLSHSAGDPEFNLTITGNLNVDSGVSISANGKGYSSSQGPGTPSGTYYAGAGYGGVGGKSSSASSTGGSTYGSITEPGDMGSGGSGNSGGIGGSGGGVIRLSVAGTLTVNGSITSDGQNGPQSYYSGGGSGGSVYITAGTLDGSGVISANGGNGSTNSGGGGGGRVAVYCGANTFTGNMSAHGGTGYQAGGAGTIYTKLPSQPSGDLSIDNNNLTGAATSLPGGDYEFDSVEIINNAELSLEAAAALETDSLSLIPNGKAVLNDGGRLNAPLVQLDSGNVFTLNEGGVAEFGQLDILSGGTFILNTVYTLPNLHISAGGILTHSEVDSGFNLTVLGDLVLDSGAYISADGKGYPAETGPGAGLNYDEGGGYGGRGGACGSSPTGGLPYGSATEPDDLGSGGGGDMGGSGGGKIKLFVNGQFIVNGIVTASGAEPGSSWDSAGSGGTVNISAGTFVGNGAVIANGGDGTSGSAGGGGGRITIYAKNNDFTGTIEAKAGEECSAEDGTVLINGSLPFSLMDMSETYTSESDLFETILVRSFDFTDINVTGDFDGVIDFNGLEFVSVETGSFAGQGFATAKVYANLGGVDYTADWQAMLFLKEVEQGMGIYLQGTLSGGLTGITEGYLVASANDVNVYDVYQSTWYLNRVGLEAVTSEVNLDGSVEYLSSTEYPSTGLRLLQTAFEGICYGDYEGPLSVVLTGIGITEAANPHYGEGFSSISHVSSLGQGQSFTYSRVTADGITEMTGPCQSPLLGIITGIIDETSDDKLFTARIEKIDFALPPSANLKVAVWGQTGISPGETVNYTLEYRNDGIIPAERVAIVYKLPVDVDFVSCTGNGIYKPYGIFTGTPEVRWFLPAVPPKSAGVLGVTITAKWGLPAGHTLETVVFVDKVDIPLEPSLSLTSTVIDANDAYVEVEYQIIADQNEVLGSFTGTCLIEYSAEEIEPNLIITEIDGNFAAYLEFTANPRFAAGLKAGGIGTTNRLEKAIMTYILQDVVEMEAIEYIGAYVSEMDYLRYLLQEDYISQEIYDSYAEQCGNTILIKYTTTELIRENYTLSDYFNLISKDIIDRITSLPKEELAAKIAEHEAQRAQDAGEEPRIPTDINSVGWEGVTAGVMKYYLNNYRFNSDYSPSQPQVKQTPENFVEDKPGFFSRIMKYLETKVAVALDPNKKYGPQGRVLPGQRLDYKVEFENIGEGIAFGVYFTDILDKNLDDSTLQIGPVKDVEDDTVMAEPGSYDPETRTITWFVGRVDPNQGGYAEYSINVDSNAVHGTEIFNYATIYFPSVPQQLRTNAIISTVLLNRPPIAEAGPDQSVYVGDLVTLDGSSSTDPDGDLITFNWRLASSPANSQAELDDPNAVNPTITIDVPGTYSLVLSVNDGTEDSKFDVIKISTLNSTPVANAGEDRAVHVGEMVTLDGSGSTDADSDLLSYSWVFDSIPAESNAVLSEPNSINPTFIADVPGNYTVVLLVNDGTVDSLPDTVLISTTNLVPVANAGEDQAVYVGDLVTLDGSMSTDPDGDTLSYDWAFTVVPQDSNAILDDPNSVNPTFIADIPGTYVVSLVVNDGTEDSQPDTVTISTLNVAPIADAGEDQAVYVGDLVMLNGSGSWDADGDELSYFWSFTVLPDDSETVLYDANTAEPNFIVDVPGTYVVGLIVNDGTVDSQPDAVSVSTLNVAPTADAGDDQSVFVGDIVTLDGSASTDLDGDELSYRWAFTSIPDESNAVLYDPNCVDPNFTPDVSGTYIVSLVVNDGMVDSEADQVTISAATQQTEPIEMVREIIDIVNGLDRRAFRNRNQKRVLMRKLNTVVHKLERHRYGMALMKLKFDILRKTNGCAWWGHPDCNDWIIRCDAQDAVYPLIVDTIEVLEEIVW